MDRQKYMTENPSISIPIIETFEELMNLRQPEIDGAIFSLYVTYSSMPCIPQTLSDYLEFIVKDYLHSVLMGSINEKDYSEETQKFLENYKTSDEFRMANKKLCNCIYGMMAPKDNVVVANSLYGCTGTMPPDETLAQADTRISQLCSIMSDLRSEGVECQLMIGDPKTPIVIGNTKKTYYTATKDPKVPESEKAKEF